MDWIWWCVVADRLDVVLKGILQSMPDPIELNEADEQVAVKRMMALEYEA